MTPPILPATIRPDAAEQPLAPPQRKHRRGSNEAHFDLRTHCYRVLGTD